MTELRRDYLTERWVIIAKERGMRPSDFKLEKVTPSSSTTCPFCPGNEYMTSPATLLYVEKDGRLTVDFDRDGERLRNWLVRVIPNLYPALKPNVDPAMVREGFMVRVGGAGVHEVIIETPRHDLHFHDLDDHHLSLVFRAYSERFVALASLPYIKYISLFKNYGNAAGASLSHPHSQIIAMPITPPRISEEMVAFKRSWDCSSCILDEVIEQESASERFVGENSVAVAFCPYASTTPFEIWLAPKRHVENITRLSEAERLSFARLLRKVLKAVNVLLGDPPYNYVFHQALDEEYHMHLRVFLRLSILGGFELNTGVVINSVPPEEAALRIRSILEEMDHS